MTSKSTTTPFENTDLPQHPDIKAAYELQASFVASGHLDAEFADHAGEMAKVIADLCAPDPHLVSAAMLVPVYMNYAYNDQRVSKKLSASLPEKTLAYLDAQTRALHPIEIEDSFPMLPKDEQHAACALITAQTLVQAKEIEKDLVNISPREIKAMADDFMTGGDPTMPALADYIDIGGIAVTSPRLMGAVDDFVNRLKQAASGSSANRVKSPPPPRR